MTAASEGPQPFSTFWLEDEFSDRTRRKTFAFSLLGQALFLAMTVYVTCCLIRGTPEIVHRMPQLPLIFSGHGGGGGHFDPLPASHGNPPRASLETQIASPTVIVPKEMPRLPMDSTVELPPEIKYPHGGPIGDPDSPFTGWLSNGPEVPTESGLAVAAESVPELAVAWAPGRPQYLRLGSWELRSRK